MTTKSPNPSATGSIFASSEVAKQWQRGKAQRDEVNAPANEMMFDLANLRAGSRVLDVAAGTGPVAHGRSTRRTDGLCIGHGHFYQHAERGCRGVHQAGFAKVDTRVMDAENLDLDADSFDAVICRMGLMLFSNPVRALIGMHRVVKPAGKVVALVWSTEEKNPCRGVPLATVRRLGSDLSAVPGLGLMLRSANPGFLKKHSGRAVSRM